MILKKILLCTIICILLVGCDKEKNIPIIIENNGSTDSNQSTDTNDGSIDNNQSTDINDGSIDSTQGTDTNNGSKNEDQNDTAMSGKLELGPIRNADVEFRILKNNIILDSTITDDTGNFKINISLLRSELLKHGYTDNTPIYIYGYDGTDIDPNDDGVLITDEEKELNGYVKGIFNIEQIKNKNKIKINLLSTYITDKIQTDGQENLTQAYIDAKSKKILKDFDFVDYDKNGKVDINDVFVYDMKDDDSIFEATLRQDYLSTLHIGKEENISATIKDLSDGISEVLFTTKELETNYALVNLVSNSFIKIEKECLNNTLNKSVFMRKNMDLKIEKDCTVAYYVCQSESNCSNKYEVYSYNNKEEGVLPYKKYKFGSKNFENVYNAINITDDGEIITPSMAYDEIKKLYFDKSPKVPSAEEVCTILKKYKYIDNLESCLY